MVKTHDLEQAPRSGEQGGGFIDAHCAGEARIFGHTAAIAARLRVADMRGFGSGVLGKLFAFGLNQLFIKNMALEQDFYAAVRQVAAAGAFYLHDGFDGGDINV